MKDVLQRVADLLRDATIARIAWQAEERANRRRREPIEVAFLDHEAKMNEISTYLKGTELHLKWCDDPSFECYVLIMD